jgi:hypothetical protein
VIDVYFISFDSELWNEKKSILQTTYLHFASGFVEIFLSHQKGSNSHKYLFYSIFNTTGSIWILEYLLASCWHMLWCAIMISRFGRVQSKGLHMNRIQAWSLVNNVNISMKRADQCDRPLYGPVGFTLSKCG